MNKTEKLKHIILSKYNSIREFSKIVEIPSTTLTSALDKGIGGMAVDRIIKICDVLNIDVKTFEPLENMSKDTNNYSEEEQQHIEDLRKLNNLGKNKVINYTKDLIEMPKYQKDNVTDLPKREKQIWEEEGKEYLMPIACHDDNLTDEEKDFMDEAIAEYERTHKK
ncbi:helix-turn-helix transcriptional regulator [Clostridium perfringens]|uniref:helix-turn-helix transcriptional regulator n=1 Tax=Clostridium perfringens TaxID=1502 RepID=UPI000D710211|nr:helix-turn-helix transcriptional regulator [Clostridium perfringens]KAB8119299.1 helix-turn-helix transcriptional regulator [Clostridium perfringens]MBO3303538.1 helix-turn-helix transcriptional regulator [Clostridium perfringens]MBO3306984.1 helix-turn-helix transcriptional regulator [Clostridium perfringens]MBO3310228.1 helix-turn-helix transcriptional regulator [Clostridium perfringens]MBO3316397.1 helix-turn-helix transcriptional regulator [Clostridium perfringens]